MTTLNGTPSGPQDKELLLSQATDDVKIHDERREMPSPKELMRARHPDLFSDTEVDASPELPKQYLSTTLTR